MAHNSLPLNYELVIYAATSFRREFRWLPDGSTPNDFTGWSAQMLLGGQNSEADVTLTSEPGGGIELTAAGQVRITMTPQQTAALVPPLRYYNLDLTDPDGFVRRFLRGRVSVVVDVRAKATAP